MELLLFILYFAIINWLIHKCIPFKTNIVLHVFYLLIFIASLFFIAVGYGLMLNNKLFIEPHVFAFIQIINFVQITWIYILKLATKIAKKPIIVENIAIAMKSLLIIGGFFFQVYLLFYPATLVVL